MTDAALLPLFAWLSPAYPVGGYAYSHGLEWAHGSGDLEDETAVAERLGDILHHGAGRNDAILLAAAHRAAAPLDTTALPEVNDLALALAPSRELHLETSQQGRSFLDATVAAWPVPDLGRAAAALTGEIAYPVAVGVASGAHGLPLGATLEAFLFGFMQALVSAAIRLGALGQTGAARVLAGLARPVVSLARAVPALTLDDVGSATFRADLGSFLHETQYTRLFRS